MNEIEKIARKLATNFYIGYNEGFCSALGYIFKGTVESLVERNWRAFINDAKEIIGIL